MIKNMNHHFFKGLGPLAAALMLICPGAVWGQGGAPQNGIAKEV
jgi:hypothetical protein